ncbi:MAG: TlpA family protein disulfide reductase [Rhodocyclales bacterium]|nr:TlpA family protein disulfide reductase [Rhodocyclales bacterium]
MLLSAAARAVEEPVRPFVAGSLQKIVGERQGRPFILALWSVSCTHCPEELKTLGRLKQANPALDVVLVSTDDAEDAPRVRELARRFGLATAPQWVFADAAPERLRFEIDRKWYGELPRTMFFDRKHQVEAVSGLVSQERLARWIGENVR